MVEVPSAGEARFHLVQVEIKAARAVLTPNVGKKPRNTPNPSPLTTFFGVSFCQTSRR